MKARKSATIKERLSELRKDLRFYFYENKPNQEAIRGLRRAVSVLSGDMYPEFIKSDAAAKDFYRSLSIALGVKADLEELIR
jgi:hypothetical protein